MTFNKENFQKWMDVARDPNTKQALGSLREESDCEGGYAYCIYGCLFRALELDGHDSFGEDLYLTSVDEFLGLAPGKCSSLFLEKHNKFITVANDKDRIPLPNLADMLELAFKDYL